jgi:NADPH:quinone reductase-like Zn-dependent oxidoreductase
MKAIVCTKPGSPDVLRLVEIAKPTPQPNEVLIKVHAATVTSGDVMLRRLPLVLLIPMRLFGHRRKRIPGHELAGEVEAVGDTVTRFKEGDRVFGTTTGLRTGANAEYACLPEEWSMGVLAKKPVNISYAEAATLPVGGMTALYILEKANIESGQKVLIYGASGSVGTFAVQLAKYFGAEVTGVCSAANAEMVYALGADKVIDYTKDDFASAGERYDAVFDAVGKISGSQTKKALTTRGTLLSVKSSTKEKSEHLVFLRNLVEEGKLTSVIDRRYPLEQTADAHRYVERGHKKGNVVITVVPEDRT